MKKVKFSEFYNYDEMVDFLREAEKEYKPMLNLRVLTETPEGRNIFLAEITDPSTGTAAEKGAYYIQAGVHAQEGAGTTAALHVIYTLLAGGTYNELLKKVTFYIIPRVNPDGMEYALTKHAEIRSRLLERQCLNGLLPQDINGDGLILNMRWEDPAGPMKEDECDPRLMVRRDPGDKKGPFYHVVEEGVIKDYDGSEIVSAMRSIDFNRNMPVNWQLDSNASFYPFSEPEMKAVGDFLVHHPNIFAGVDFHCGSNGILRSAMIPDHDMNQEDMDLILKIGREAEKITGLPLIHEREYKQSWKPPEKPYGDSNGWAYYKLGISHYVIELGNGYNCAGFTTHQILEADEQKWEKDFMRSVLAYHDKQGSSIFVPWKEFQHQQLGKVDIGGLLKGYAYYMYPPIMEELSPKTSAFVMHHASYCPELIITNVKTVHLGDEICRIRATVGNIGGFDTKVMKAGGSSDITEPVRVKVLLPENAEVVSYAREIKIDNLRALGGTKNLEWFVKSPSGSEAVIEASHPRAGTSISKVIL